MIVIAQNDVRFEVRSYHGKVFKNGNLSLLLWFPGKSLIKDALRDERNFLTLVFQIKLKKGASSVRRITGIDIEI